MHSKNSPGNIDFLSNNSHLAQGKWELIVILLITKDCCLRSWIVFYFSLWSFGMIHDGQTQNSRWGTGLHCVTSKCLGLDTSFLSTSVWAKSNIYWPSCLVRSSVDPAQPVDLQTTTQLWDIFSQYPNTRVSTKHLSSAHLGLAQIHV